MLHQESVLPLVCSLDDIPPAGGSGQGGQTGGNQGGNSSGGNGSGN